MRLRLRRGLTPACLAAMLAFSGNALGAATPPLGHAGRWITDARGRVLVIHGINMVYKLAPFYPSAAGFGADDAAFLKRIGFNAVRVGVLWQALEPRPGVFDEGYLANIEATVTTLARQRIVSLLDFHQDQYNTRFEGEGFPDWSVQDDGLPAEPKLGFGADYVGMPALSHAFDHFWANSPGPGGIGLQDRYGTAWRDVAKRFRANPNVLGYELMNEPWPGTVFPTCAQTQGCPTFDSGPLAAFYRRMLGAIRSVDRRTLVWYEPQVLFNYGSATRLPPLGDRSLGFAFHDYCLEHDFHHTSTSCPTFDDTVFGNALAHAATTGDALLETEWGATTDPQVLTPAVRRADRNMVSWFEWHYCGCKDPTTSGPGSEQAIVLDPHKPPSGANLNVPTLRQIVEPYPQLVSGTPQGWGFDPSSRSFRFTYTPARAGGHGSFPAGSPTDVATPPLAYPHGYAAHVNGAAIVSRRGAGVLALLSCPGAGSVTVTATPSGTSRGSCRPALSVSVAPRGALLQRRTRFRIRVFAVLGAYRVPLAGAVVRLGSRRARTDARGRATLSVTLHRNVRRYGVLARAAGYGGGRAYIRVLGGATRLSGR